MPNALMKDAFIKSRSMKEEAVLFGEKKSLVGVVTDPPTTTGNHLRPAVILLNPGIVHRVGPGRIYVKIARALAAAGFVVLRFDFSGIGDSAVRHDNLQFEKSAIREAQDAMDFLKSTRGIEHFVCLGGCSGALISLETARCDPRAIGAVLINYPVTEDEDGSANADLVNRRAAHYYWNFALFNLKSWRKFFTGRANYRQLMQVLRLEAKRQFASKSEIPREATEFEANLRQLTDRGARLTFLCSQGDPLLDELRKAGGSELQHLCVLGKVTLDIIPRSDHTFSSLDDHEQLLEVILKRINGITRLRKRIINAPQAASDVETVSVGDSVGRVLD